MEAGLFVMMKTIGMIGGLSWESSQEYYRLINQAVRARLGGHHSARTLMYSFDFAEIEALQSASRWDSATDAMIAAAQRLERGGADLLIICSNTMHRMAGEVEAAVSIPLLHIADATAAQIIARRYDTVGLLGTRYTMEQAFYKGRLADRFGLNVLTPAEPDADLVNRVIYDELVMGEVRPQSRAEYIRIIRQLAEAGAQAVILGCTEITLLIKPEHSPLPAFDTTTIHALAAVDAALEPIGE